MKCQDCIRGWNLRRRPPRGGRGLKSRYQIAPRKKETSPPSRGAWIEITVSSSVSGAQTVAPLAGGVD